jgi:hypothetical protein
MEARVLLAGYSAVYYDNADLSSPTVLRVDQAIDFDWGASSPNPAAIQPSTFSARWTGRIKPAYSETYTFTATADDGVRVWVNGTLLVDRWGDRPQLFGDANKDGTVDFKDFQMLEVQYGTPGPETDFDRSGTVDDADFTLLYNAFGKSGASTIPVNSGTIDLVAGQRYDVAVEYYQNTGDAKIKFEWQSARQAPQVVPPAPDEPGGGGEDGGVAGPIVGSGLLATYYDDIDLSGYFVQRIDPQVSFRWSGFRPHPRIETDTFSVRWAGYVEAGFSEDYTFLVNSDDGARMWVDDQLVLDYWGDKAESEYPSDPVRLTAGQKHKIKLEYYQNHGDAVAELKWVSAHTAYGIVPANRLFAADLGSGSGGGGVVLPPPPPPPTQQKLGPLKVSSDGRQVVKSDGSPFFWMSDTVWSLINDGTRADVDYYIGDRASKEFTVFQTIIANDGKYTTNVYGEPTFLNRDLYQPNDAYFQGVDYVLNQATAAGLFVALLPTWGDTVSDPAGRQFDVDSARAYGTYLGTRYKSQANIIWVLGGDWDSDDATSRAIWRSMAAGLQEGDGGSHLITYHPRGGSASSEWYHNDAWEAFNTVQSGHTRDSKSWEMITNDWNKSPAKPTLDFEPNYEAILNGLKLDGEPLTDFDVRKKAYWDVFAGAFGVTYGAWEVYSLHPGGGRFPNRPNWKEALNYPGARQMRWLRRLMQSRPMAGRVPDQSIITSNTYADTSGNHIRATRASDGSYAFVYSAGGQSFTVNMSKIAGGSVTAWWFDPRSGEAESIGTFSNTGTRTFAPPAAQPGQSGNDWVLVLDNASKGYGTPGVGVWNGSPAAPVATSRPAASIPVSRPTPKPKSTTAVSTLFSVAPVKKIKAPQKRAVSSVLA